MARLKQRRRKPAGQDAGLRRAPTLADVARIAGVSKMTASRALGRQEMVAPETAAQVRAAADLLAYVPNEVAGGLSSRTSRVTAPTRRADSSRHTASTTRATSACTRAEVDGRSASSRAEVDGRSARSRAGGTGYSSGPYT